MQRLPNAQFEFDPWHQPGGGGATAARRANIAMFAIRARGLRQRRSVAADALIAAVVANAAVVVLGRRAPGDTAWRDSVNAIMQAWYPGERVQPRPLRR